ncbi:MAG: inactive transglutaminase family protein [Porticoccaceae bacterium]
MKNLAVLVWAAILIVLGSGICAYKAIKLGLPVKADQETTVWTVQARIGFQGEGGPAIVDLALPSVLPGFLKLDENFIANRYGMAIDETGDQRKAQWVKRRARGAETLYYRISVAASDQPANWRDQPALPALPDYEEPYATAIRTIINDVREESADVFTYTRTLLRQLNAPQPNQNVALLRARAQNPHEWTNQVIDILKGVRIPGRILWALPLEDATNDAHMVPLLQVHNGKTWLVFNPATGDPGLPAKFLPWRIGDAPLFTVTGGHDIETKFSVTRSHQELLEVVRHSAQLKGSIFGDLSLLSLPVQSQNIYRVLLMVPLGALIVVLMRTFVGISTFGTFMPVLIALAFRETQLLWGIVLFSLIVSIGLMLRFYLERLMLLLVPRLTAILIIVVGLMLLTSLITNKLGVERTLSVALFPMVILSMTIERMSITWEESGARDAILNGLGSLLIASLSYLVMNQRDLEHLVFVFPELLLVALGLSLLMGRYTGYRLSELRRFRDFRGTPHA